jgi:hypothetical protein
MADSNLLNSFTLPSINNLLASAVITHRPLIVVEGKDDIQFYDTICEKIERDFKIVAVENINGYTEGCEKVIALTFDLQSQLNSPNDFHNLFLGIIDKDVRNYRDLAYFNSINGYLNLFILNYYSYESHYISSENIKKIIRQFTSINNELLTELFITNLFSEVTNSIVDILYYPSLEALKNATNQNYASEVGYSDKVNEFIKNPNKIANINAKIDDLNHVAASFNISKNFDDLKLFAKGKWILDCFSELMKSKIKTLHDSCKNGNISQCQYCEYGVNDKCLYKPKPLLTNANIASLILPLIDVNETQYIFQKLSQLN